MAKRTSPPVHKYAMLLLLPLILAFDVIVLLWTQHGCIAMGCFSDFFKQSSLSLYVINQAFPNAFAQFMSHPATDAGHPHEPHVSGDSV